MEQTVNEQIMTPEFLIMNGFHIVKAESNRRLALMKDHPDVSGEASGLFGGNRVE